MSLPPGTYARIAPRSGLAIINFIDVGAGVVDLDYWGETKVVLFNHSAEDFKVQAGERIAQLILERLCYEVWDPTTPTLPITEPAVLTRH